ncbi:MAG: efflux RND transporter periplasmic adaptor subunit [Oligoflexales bacterium]
MDFCIRIFIFLSWSQNIIANITPIQGYGLITTDKEYTTHLSSHYSGIISHVYFKEGDYIKKGSTFASLEKSNGFNHFHFKSPLDGTIIENASTQGQMIQKGDIIATITDLKHLWSIFNIHNKYSNKIQKNMIIKISDLGKKNIYSSKIIYISPILKDQTQTFEVITKIENPHHIWTPNQFVHGSITGV